MRFWIFSFLALFCLSHEVAAKPKKAVPSAVRAPASLGRDPSRVIIFTCRDPDSGVENAIGLTHMNIDIRDNSTGAFSMSLYLRQDKGFVTKSVTGSYTTVPNGYIFRTKWRSLQGEFAMIHVHPAEKTSFPGLAGKQSCEVSGQLEAL